VDLIPPLEGLLLPVLISPSLFLRFPIFLVDHYHSKLKDVSFSITESEYAKGYVPAQLLEIFDDVPSKVSQLCSIDKLSAFYQAARSSESMTVTPDEFDFDKLIGCTRPEFYNLCT